MPIRAISFDLFDTLVDLHLDALPEVELDGRRWRGTQPALHAALRESAPIELDALLRTLEEVDRDLRGARAAAGRELPTLERFSELTARLGVEDPGLPGRLTDVHMTALRSCARAPAHHAGLLRALAAHTPLALCSNFSHAPTARALLSELEMGEWLDPAVISEEVGFRKPRPEIFRAVLEGLGLPAECVLHVGDRLDADVAGAAALGLRTAWLTRRVPDPEAQRSRYDGPAPDWTLSDLRELPDRLGAPV